MHAICSTRRRYRAQARQRRRAACAVAGLLALLCLGDTAQAQTGHLRIESPVAGMLLLRHAEGGEFGTPIRRGITTLWELPAGVYEARFGAYTNIFHVQVLPGLTAQVELHSDDRQIRVEQQPVDAPGSLLAIAPQLWTVMPGSKEQILADLDTAPRWRPSTRIAGIAPEPVAERSALLPGQRKGLGPSFLALPRAGWASEGVMQHLTLAHPMLAEGIGERAERNKGWGRLFAEVGYSTRENAGIGGHLGLAAKPLGVPLRGLLSLGYASLEYARPRAVGERILPHDDGVILDLTTRLEFGAPRVSPMGSRLSEQPGNWKLAFTVISRGWERNHFLEEYRYNTDHAPHEDTGHFQGRADFDLRLGETSLGRAWLGYDRFLTWLGDGTYRQNLLLYGRVPSQGNGGSDDTGLYWSDGSGGTGGPHVFDYFVRKYTTTYRGGLDLRLAHSDQTLWGLRGEVAAHTYRRYEHFSPIHTRYAGDVVAYGKALAIGYDITGTNTQDDPHEPGKLQTARTTLWTKKHIGERWCLDAGLGAHFFACAESSLVSVEAPLGDNGQLDAGDFRKTDSQVDPEFHLQLTGRLGQRLDIWGVGYRQARMPPLEALFSPRAYLAMIGPEGVMGNPSIVPEKETGVEIGAALPFSLAEKRWRLGCALYAGRIDETVTLTASTIGTGGEEETLTVPAYESGGRMRRYGLHLEAQSGDQQGAMWFRVAYDLSRVESDRFEPPLLDGPWLYPDRPQGEYESEGLAGPIGGIYDGLDDLESGTFRPANMDRLHRVSLALTLRDRPAATGSDVLARVVRGWKAGTVARFESGRPYTQIYIYPAGVLPGPDEASRGPGEAGWEQRVEGTERNGRRMPSRFTLDLNVARPFRWLKRTWHFGFEVLNLLAIENAQAVYRATGEPNDDGCMGSQFCALDLPDGVDADLYSSRITDPRLYDRGFVLRATLSLELP